MPEILPLEEAVKKIAARTPIGSLLRSADWRRVPLMLRERAQFSSGVVSARLLQTIQDRLQAQLAMQREQLVNGNVATFDRSSFIDAVREIGVQEGLSPEASKQGTIEDITSVPRLGLIYDMQNEMATGFARWKMDQSEGAMLLYPAWEFTRTEERRVPREQLMPGFWARRWLSAAKESGDDGALKVLGETQRMVAMKTSGIWTALSIFGTPWPPFDWGSGMGVEDVDRDTAIALGLLEPDEVPQADGEKDFNDNLQASVKGLGSEMLDFLKESFGDQVTVEGDEAVWNGS